MLSYQPRVSVLSLHVGVGADGETVVPNLQHGIAVISTGEHFTLGSATGPADAVIVSGNKQAGLESSAKNTQVLQRLAAGD